MCVRDYLSLSSLKLLRCVKVFRENWVCSYLNSKTITTDEVIFIKNWAVVLWYLL